MFLPLSDELPTRRTPVLYWIILAANVAAFALTGLAMPPRQYERFLFQFGFVPDHPSLLTILTSMFLHGDVLHLLGNMLYFWIFADNVEDRMGRGLFLVFYLTAGFAAVLAHWGVAEGLGDEATLRVPCVGASGAISGVLGAYLVFHPRQPVKALLGFSFFVRLVWVPAWVLIGMWFLLQLLAGSTSLGGGHAVSVAYWAHIGGFAYGALLAAFLRFALPSPGSPGPWRPRG